MWWLLMEVVLDLMVAGSVVAALKARDRHARERDRRALVLLALLVFGFLVGLLSGTLVPGRVVPAWPFKGISLLVVPLTLGCAMEMLGRLRTATRSHPATWYGGATLGLGLAAGRFLVVSSALS